MLPIVFKVFFIFEVPGLKELKALLKYCQHLIQIQIIWQQLIDSFDIDNMEINENIANS